jgi:hypothetical protein
MELLYESVVRGAVQDALDATFGDIPEVALVWTHGRESD